MNITSLKSSLQPAGNTIFKAVTYVCATPKRVALYFLISGLATTIFMSLYEDKNLADGLYMSIVTMGTVGYGDMLPQTILGKIFISVMIFSWVIALVVLGAHVNRNFIVDPEAWTHNEQEECLSNGRQTLAIVQKIHGVCKHALVILRKILNNVVVTRTAAEEARSYAKATYELQLAVATAMRESGLNITIPESKLATNGTPVKTNGAHVMSKS